MTQTATLTEAEETSAQEISKIHIETALLRSKRISAVCEALIKKLKTSGLSEPQVYSSNNGKDWYIKLKAGATLPAILEHFTPLAISYRHRSKGNSTELLDLEVAGSDARIQTVTRHNHCH